MWTQTNKHGFTINILVCSCLLLYRSGAEADQVKSQRELAALPRYCWGTQGLREVSKDPRPIEQYVAAYGDAYRHLHHFCYALNSENKAYTIRDEMLRDSKLRHAIKDIDYVLDRAPDTFVFLPEIYVARARILFKIDRDSEALMNLNKALRINPDNPSAYNQLSRYYGRIGDTNAAIQTLEEGIKNSNRPDGLIKRLKEFGIIYNGPLKRPTTERAILGPQSSPPAKTETDKPEHSREKEASTHTVPHLPHSLPKESSSLDDLSDERRDNPYCRFCPIE